MNATRRPCCFLCSARGKSTGLTHSNKKMSSLQDPQPSQGSSGSHQHYCPKVISPVTESFVAEAGAVSGFLGEISAAGVSCCWAFPPSYAIHLPDRRNEKREFHHHSTLHSKHYNLQHINTVCILQHFADNIIISKGR